MTLEILRLLRNVLLRSFVVGAIFGVFFGIVTVAGWHTWIGLATRWMHADEAAVSRVLLNFFIEIRFFVIFVLLAPGLAMHWTLKREEARKA